MMFVKTPAMFYFLRFLMGAFEAGFQPGVILYLTYWYPSNRRASAFGMFVAAGALSGVIGGPLAGTIMNNLQWRQRLARLAMGVPDRRHPVDPGWHRDLLLPDQSPERGQVADGRGKEAGASRPRARRARPSAIASTACWPRCAIRACGC